MKYYHATLLLILLGVGCSSAEKEQKADVKEEIESTAYKDVTPANHYSRAISMVESDQKLNDSEKKNLVKLIEEYGGEVQKRRNLQSKYRALLVHEMLQTGEKKNPKVDAARDELIELDKTNSKELQKFIRDFKFYAGENARIHQPTLLEVINM